MFRGNLQRTGSYNTDAKFPSGQLDWKFKADYELFTSPVIAGDTVFVNGAGGYLYAVDTNSGKSRWVFEREKWTGSSPAILNQVVYVGGLDHFLYAINTKTGLEEWRFEAQDMIISSPAISDSMVFFGSYDGHLYAVDADTGKEKWKFKTQGAEEPFSQSAAPEYDILGAIVSSPAVAKGIVYFGSCDGYLYALEAKTGAEKWKFNAGSSLNSSPAVSNGIIYFGSNDGYFHAIDSNGQLKWKFKTQDSALVSSAAVVNDTVYFASSFDRYDYQDQHDYFLYAAGAETGKTKWKIQLPAVTHWLTVSSSVLYFGDDNGVVFALDAKSGKELWNFKAESSIASDVVIVGGKAYFCTKDGYLYALQ